MIALDNPVRGVEYPQDVFALHVMQPGILGVIEIDGRLGWHEDAVHAGGGGREIGAAVGCVRRQDFRRNLEQRRSIQYERAFYEAFELADVSRPGVVRERRERV